MMKVRLEETNNGFIVEVAGAIRTNGKYIFRGIDHLKMLEFIAKAIFDKNFEVKEK